MNRSAQPSRNNDPTTVAPEAAQPRAGSSDTAPVASQRRPARSRVARQQEPREEDEAPDTIPAPMWFIEE